jgi:hypothetical protein
VEFFRRAYFSAAVRQFLHGDKTRRILVEVAEIVRTTDNLSGCLPVQRHRALWFFEIALVLVRLDHIASGIVNVDRSIVRMTAVFRVVDCFDALLNITACQMAADRRLDQSRDDLYAAGLRKRVPARVVCIHVRHSIATGQECVARISAAARLIMPDDLLHPGPRFRSVIRRPLIEDGAHSFTVESQPESVLLRKFGKLPFSILIV